MLADNSVDFVWEVDMELNIVYASPGVYKLHGFSPDEALKMNTRDLYPPEKLLEIFKIIERELALGKKSTGALFETTAIHKNGNHFPVEVAGKIIFDENEKAISISGYTKDITERKTC